MYRIIRILIRSPLMLIFALIMTGSALSGQLPKLMALFGL